jgi:nitrite reductase (NADH) large subunit
MKAVIVGNGLAGTMAAKSLRELDASVEIEVIAGESYPYYPRPNLIDFMAGVLPYERLFAFPANWHERQNIAVRVGAPVVRIDPAAGTVETRDGRTSSFDRLLVANGSSAVVPPVKGSDKKGVFVLRTLDDALSVLEALKTRPRVAVLGGGLLGLEIARALKARGAEVSVNEFFDRLLPRQLDPLGASLLKAQLERLGIGVRLGVAAEEIRGEGEASGLRFKDGSSAEADVIIFAAGVRPNVSLAKEAGIVTDNGVVVDDHLRTSHPAVYAAGDVAQHNGRVYGIIPASFDQARAAAFNMLGMDKRYEGTVPSNTLKVLGVFVTSVGLVNPDGPGYEVLAKEDVAAGTYRKLVLKDGVLAGAIWMGTKKGAADIARLTAARKNVAAWKADILEDGFDLAGLWIR